MKYGFDSISSSSSADSDSDSDSPPLRPPKPKFTFTRPPLPRSHSSTSTSSASSSSSSTSSSSNKPTLLLPSSSSDDESEEDSEDEEFPVGPLNSIGPRSGFRRNTSSTTSKGGGEVDEIENWDKVEKTAAWSNANKKFASSLRLAISSRSTSSKPPLKTTTTTGITNLLHNLTLAQTQSQLALQTSFEERNKSLWKSIEDSIREAGRMEAESLEVERERERKAMERRRKGEEEARRKGEEEVKRRAEEEEARQVELRRKVEEEKQAVKAREEEEKLASANASTQTSYNEYLHWVSVMTTIKTQVLPTVSSTPTYRTLCFKTKRLITPKIGQLTSSLSSLRLILNSLHTTLLSLLPPSSPTPPSFPSDSNFNLLEPYFWALNHLSKALIKQAETETTARIETCYPLGRVVVGLIGMGHQGLGEVLMARLVKKCWWVGGIRPRATPGATPESYAKSLGHLPTETSSLYSLRISGLLALHTAISLTPPTPSSPPPPYFRPGALWTTLVRLLTPPLWGLEETPLVVFTILQVGGSAMEEVFAGQWRKLLRCLEVELRRAGGGGGGGTGEGGPVRKSGTARLELWLEDWGKKGGKGVELGGRGGDP